MGLYRNNELVFLRGANGQKNGQIKEEYYRNLQKNWISDRYRE